MNTSHADKFIHQAQQLWILARTHKRLERRMRRERLELVTSLMASECGMPPMVTNVIMLSFQDMMQCGALQSVIDNHFVQRSETVGDFLSRYKWRDEMQKTLCLHLLQKVLRALEDFKQDVQGMESLNSAREIESRLSIVQQRVSASMERARHKHGTKLLACQGADYWAAPIGEFLTRAEDHVQESSVGAYRRVNALRMQEGPTRAAEGSPIGTPAPGSPIGSTREVAIRRPSPSPSSPLVQEQFGSLTIGPSTSLASASAPSEQQPSSPPSGVSALLGGIFHNPHLEDLSGSSGSMEMHELPTRMLQGASAIEDLNARPLALAQDAPDLSHIVDDVSMSRRDRRELRKQAGGDAGDESD